MAKFKVGDKVRIIKKAEKSHSTGKYDYIGDIFTVTGINVVDTFPYSLSGTGYWWCDEELKLVVHTQFTKADLKDGMVVEVRNNTRNPRYMVLNGKLRGVLEYMDLMGFNDDLTHTGDYEHLDIVKVYESDSVILNEYFNDRNLTLIWERPKEEPAKEMTIEEIEKILGHKIKVVGSEEK